MPLVDYFFRGSSRGKKHQGSIYIEVIQHKVSRIITTSFKIYPDEWDSENSRIIMPAADDTRYDYLKGIQQELDRQKKKLLDIIDKMEAHGRFYTAADLSAIYKDMNSEIPIAPFSRKLSKDLYTKGQNRTARAYESVLRGFIQYMGDENISFSQITPENIQGFEADLKEKEKTLNTISFYMRNLRAIYNKAIKEKLIVNRWWDDPFANVYTGVEKAG